MDNIRSDKLGKFLQLKDSTLNRDDLSLKGSIDELIRPLVTVINQSQYYYTTSTCSGRTTLIEKPYGQPGIKKVIRDFVNNQHKDETSCLWLKFEPLIMHIQCFDLSRAQTLLNIALEKGCRNSGITIGQDYINFLREECGRRLAENKSRLQNLQQAIETKLQDNCSSEAELKLKLDKC